MLHCQKVMGMQWGYYYLAKVQQIAMIFGCVGERVIPEHCQFHYDRCWSSNSWDNPFILLGNDGRLAGSTSWGITNLAAESELRHRQNHGKLIMCRRDGRFRFFVGRMYPWPLSAIVDMFLQRMVGMFPSLISSNQFLLVWRTIKSTCFL
jgi:hypothetical protein